jgi:hypothetical protein
MTQVMLQVTIDRAAAIMAGKSSYGDVIVSVNPATLTQEQREELASLPTMTPRDGGQVLYGNRRPTTPIADPTPDAIARYLDEHRQQRLAEKAEKEADQAKRDAEYIAEVKEWLEKPDDQMLTTNYPASEYHARVDVKAVHSYGLDRIKTIRPDLHQAYKLRLAKLNAVAEEQTTKLKAENARKSKEAAARHQEAEQKMAAALEAFLSERGTDVQRKRRAAKLMPDEEVLAMVRDHVFAPLDNLPRYERMKADDYRDYDDEKIDFETRDAESATDEQFESMEAIRKLIPGATVELREHVASKDDEEKEVRPGFLVTVAWNGHKLSREYAA